MNGMIMLAMVGAILAPNIALAWRVQRLTNEVRSLRKVSDVSWAAQKSIQDALAEIMTAAIKLQETESTERETT